MFYDVFKPKEKERMTEYRCPSDDKLNKELMESEDFNFKKNILKLLHRRNQHKWVVTYMEDWITLVDIDKSIIKLKGLIKELK